MASGAGVEGPLASAVLGDVALAAPGTEAGAALAADFDGASLALAGATGASLALAGATGAALALADAAGAALALAGATGASLVLAGFSTTVFVCGAWFASMNLRTRGRMLSRQLFPAKMP